MLTTLVALFGAGLASFLAPCVLPLVPVYLGMVTGEFDPDRAGAVLRATALFVAGFAAVFVALGTAAGTIGGVLGDGRGALVRGSGVLIIGFGVVMAGGGGGRLQRAARFRCPLPSGAVARPLVLGVTFGAAWSPCVGPLLGAALVAAAGSGSGWRGAVALGTYAAGLGTPFLAVSAGLAWTPRVQRQLRSLAPVLARLGAVFLVLVGAAALAGRLPDVLIGF